MLLCCQPYWKTWTSSWWCRHSSSSAWRTLTCATSFTCSLSAKPHPYRQVSVITIATTTMEGGGQDTGDSYMPTGPSYPTNGASGTSGASIVTDIAITTGRGWLRWPPLLQVGKRTACVARGDDACGWWWCLWLVMVLSCSYLLVIVMLVW